VRTALTEPVAPRPIELKFKHINELAGVAKCDPGPVAAGAAHGAAQIHAFEERVKT
jgi:hypothetical protein